MSHSPTRLIWVLSLAVLLAGCGSSPRSNHYLLTAADAIAPAGESPSLGIGPIQIPEYLNRYDMVFNQQGNQVNVASSQRWAEPLGDGIQRVLSLNLATLLNTGNVRSFPWQVKRAPDYAVKINLLSLDANDQQATMTAEWLVYRPGTGGTVSRRISRLQIALPQGELRPAQVAPAYSDLLQQLSVIIARTITADQQDSAAASDNQQQQ